MRTHSYVNLRHAVLHSVDVIVGHHRIHQYFTTIFYDDICWC